MHQKLHSVVFLLTHKKEENITPGKLCSSLHRGWGRPGFDDNPGLSVPSRICSLRVGKIQRANLHEYVHHGYIDSALQHSY